MCRGDEGLSGSLGFPLPGLCSCLCFAAEALLKVKVSANLVALTSGEIANTTYAFFNRSRNIS